MQIGVGFFFAKISPALALGVCAFAWGIVSSEYASFHTFPGCRLKSVATRSVLWVRPFVRFDGGSESAGGRV